MSWQTDTINPAVTSPAVDITKITNDLQVLRDTFENNLDPDVPVVLDATKLTGQVPDGSLATSGTPSDTSFLAGDRVWRTVASLQPASTAEAAAGTSNTVAITPLRMREGFNASGSAPVYACRAWVNFDGLTGSGNTIRGSGNVSSVTRTATGKYEINLTTAMPDANYATVVGANKQDVNDDANLNITTGTTSIFQTTTKAFVTTGLGSGVTLVNSPQISVAIFR
jgi:hypothetical protein